MKRLELLEELLSCSFGNSTNIIIEKRHKFTESQKKYHQTSDIEDRLQANVFSSRK